MSEDKLVIPITPQEAVQQFYSNVPPGVIKCWNDCISENISMRGKDVYSKVTLHDLSKKITAKMNCTHQEAHEKGWFDLEDIFRKQGWNVRVDKPSYYESYETYFEFTNR